MTCICSWPLLFPSSVLLARMWLLPSRTTRRTWECRLCKVKPQDRRGTFLTPWKAPVLKAPAQTFTWRNTLLSSVSYSGNPHHTLVLLICLSKHLVKRVSLYLCKQLKTWCWKQKVKDPEIYIGLNEILQFYISWSVHAFNIPVHICTKDLICVSVPWSVIVSGDIDKLRF